MLISISCLSKNKYEVEKILYKSISDRFQEVGYNLDSKISELERYLIDNKVLTGISGEDLVAFFEDLKHNDGFNGYITDELYNGIKIVSFFEFLQTECLDTIISVKPKYIEKSKLYGLQKAFKELGFIKAPSFSKYGQIFLTCLDANSFENKFYKTLSILFIAQTMDVDSGLSQRLSLFPKPDNLEIKPRNSLPIILSSNKDSVLVKNDKVSINDLISITLDYVLYDKADSLMPEVYNKTIDLIGECKVNKLVITITKTADIDYETYINVQNQIVKAYEIARNHKSNMFFNSDFYDLRDDQKNAIKEIIIQRIREPEPDE
jgi:hypothetical protein